MSVFLGKHRVDPPPHVIPAPRDSIAAKHLKSISEELELRFNTLTQRFEVWNPGGLVKVVEGTRGEYVEPGMWLAAQLRIPMEMQIRAIDDANRRLKEEQLKKRRNLLEAMTSDKFWVKGFVAALTRDFTHIDKVFHVKVPWKK